MVKHERRDSVRKMEKGCALAAPVVASQAAEGRTKKIISKGKKRSILPRVKTSETRLAIPMALIHVGAKLKIEASHRPNRATFMRDPLHDIILRHLQNAMNDYWLTSERRVNSEVHTLSSVTIFTAITLLTRVHKHTIRDRCRWAALVALRQAIKLEENPTNYDLWTFTRTNDVTDQWEREPKSFLFPVSRFDNDVIDQWEREYLEIGGSWMAVPMSDFIGKFSRLFDLCPLLDEKVAEISRAFVALLSLSLWRSPRLFLDRPSLSGGVLFYHTLVSINNWFPELPISGLNLETLKTCMIQLTGCRSRGRFQSLNQEIQRSLNRPPNRSDARVQRVLRRFPVLHHFYDF
ncbi:MAG: hypothetical protein KVP17_005128 [Porospora cf. gigantea B]|uniref:uncharacterized protein n=1 Tax=Porospora cf. gigantea B TaxID=2853592 RepID=UPI003571CDE7|nr:MAG: hypothetical protein KVP17_005128 [Porospora cf. gigantea B]